MTQDLNVINQWLIDFTVEILYPDERTAGTGVAVSNDGKIVTCAHVVKGVLEGVHPREAGDAEITVYFRQAKRKEDKQRQTRVIGVFPDHDDDVVLLQIVNGTMPLAPEQIAVIGGCDQSAGHEFQSYGFREAIGIDDPLFGEGNIIGVLPIPRQGNFHSGKVQLKTQDVNIGMSGAAVLDKEQNLVVGIISSKYYPEQRGVDEPLAFGVNARVLSLEPLLLSLYSGSLPYPRRAGATPRLTEAQERQVKAAPPPRAYDLSRAPEVLPEWVGRTDLLARVADDYANPAICVTGLIGFGGEGKTSLARKALDAILNDADRPAAVFWWSFYEQRSSDEFFEAALTYLGGAALAQTVTSAAARAGMLAGLLRERRCVFVLDGFEVMQEDEGDSYGNVVSGALRDFLALFASPFHQSFCLITSRAPLTNLLAHTTYRQRDVTRLSDSDGRDLLRRVGVQGDDAALDQIVAAWDGHALTLSLIGTYLVEQFGGDAARAGDLPAPTADEDHYARVARVLRRYDEHLSEAERAFLLMFSAFRLPVREDAFGKVFRTATDATALNAPLTGLDDAAFAGLVQGLVTRRLIRPVEQDGATAYTAHPLIRAHYAERLVGDSSAAAHRQIADYYQADAPRSMPRFPTLDDLMPYIEIVHHLCRAEAYDEGASNPSRIGFIRVIRWVINSILGAYETDACADDRVLPRRRPDPRPGGEPAKRPELHPQRGRLVLDESGAAA